MSYAVVVFGWVLAFSPWDAPGIDPASVQHHTMRQCFDNDGSSGPAASKPAVASSRSRARDEVEPAQIERGPPPAAFIAVGATLLAAGSAMRIPAPMYMEINRAADPNGRSAATAAITSYTHTPRQIALGTVGTVLQAIGVGALQHGIQRQRHR